VHTWEVKLSSGFMWHKRPVSQSSPCGKVSRWLSAFQDKGS
jgi:hypothetical protein